MMHSLERSLGVQMFGCGSSQSLLQALFQVASISGLTAARRSSVVIREDPDKS